MLKLNKSAVPAQVRKKTDLTEAVARLKQCAPDLSLKSAATEILASMSDHWLKAGDLERFESERQARELNKAAAWGNENYARMIEDGRRTRQMQEDLHIVAEAERKRATEAAPVVALSPVVKPSQVGVLKKKCPEWFKSILRSSQFRDRVEEGAAAVGEVLVPGKDFSASAVVQALEKLGFIPEDTNRKTMQAAVRAFYDTYKWKSRDRGEEKADSLVEHYKRGESIAKQADDAVASKARATMRGV